MKEMKAYRLTEKIEHGALEIVLEQHARTAFKAANAST
jgi:hypothetical protein